MISYALEVLDLTVNKMICGYSKLKVDNCVKYQAF